MSGRRHVHLDPVGGVAGDMFAAALLDAFPDLAEGVGAAAGALAGVQCRVVPHKDAVLAGSRFEVAEAHRHHHHTHWSDIRARIAGSGLPQPVRGHATGIFAALAEAEGRVHGIDPEQVEFHEVGAADSIADIVAAAWLIDAIGPATWSVSPLPLGSGMVKTAHGMLPVPAPATALLLEGFDVIDDGVPGERVTPTGAAILRYLGCMTRPDGLRLQRSGIGFGTRVLPGRSNCLRAMVFDRVAAAADHRELLVVTFEVDDQSGEDLATGIDRLRAHPGVHDVIQMPAYGKKGRMTTHVQVLAHPEAGEAVIAACFQETTTIGLRTQAVAARALPRRIADVAVDGATVRVKLVERPGGDTGKAELDDLAATPTHAARARLRRLAEEAAE
jgi:uncharacterized protein (TIGR00299 family) protein